MKESKHFELTGKKAFVTTHGWDGKDYEGTGRWFPTWKIKTPCWKGIAEIEFIRIYCPRYKGYAFLKITDRCSAAGVPEVSFHCLEELDGSIL